MLKEIVDLRNETKAFVEMDESEVEQYHRTKPVKPAPPLSNRQLLLIKLLDKLEKDPTIIERL